MADIGIPDFSLMDWLKPEPRRLTILLSGVINFARFRDVNLAVFDELTQRSVCRGYNHVIEKMLIMDV